MDSRIPLGLFTSRPLQARSWAVALLCWLAFLAPLPCKSLELDRSLAQLHHKGWQSRDGAPSQITALVQTPDGYLWLGSNRGLFRFDGDRFESFLRVGDSSLPSHNIYALAVGLEGELWISFRPSGLGQLKNGKLTIFQDKKDLPEYWIYQLLVDKEGRLWAATHGGLAMRADGRWHEIGPDMGLPRKRIRGFHLSRRGTLWVATEGKLYSLEAGAIRFRESGTDVGDGGGIAEAPDGSIWVGGSGAVTRVVDETGRVARQPRRLSTDGSFGLMFDQNGALWTTSATGVQRVRYPNRLQNDGAAHDSLAETFGKREGLTSTRSELLLEDREGNVWVSAHQGINRFRHSHFVPVALPDAAQHQVLAAGRNGDVWSASYRDVPLVRIDERAKIGAHAAVPESDNNVSQASSVALARTEGDTHRWWGVLGGIWTQGPTGTSFSAAPSRFSGERPWELMINPVGDGLWVGMGDDGIWHWQDGLWQPATRPQGMIARVPSASFTDDAGALWLGYTENRVHRVSRQGVQQFGAKDGVDVGRIRVIRNSPDALWVGGELGLLVLRGNRFHRVKIIDRPLGAVVGIIDDGPYGIWLAEQGGVVQIPAGEVDQLVSAPERAVRAIRYDHLDGLPGGMQINVTASLAVKASDGVLWFSTDGGLAWIDPNKMRRNTLAPTVRILGIEAEGTRFPATNTPDLPIGTRNLRVQFTAMSLSIPERVRFRYRLKGYDDTWRDSAGQREATFTHLVPGDYQMEVVAANNDGVWSREAAISKFSIPPAFYQTHWFMVLVISALLATGVAIYLARVRQLEQRVRDRLNERYDERERIARDLHDTLLQGVHGLMMFMHAGAKQLPENSAVRERFQRSIAIAENVVAEGRDRVSQLRSNASADSPLELALNDVGEQLSEDYGAGFKSTVRGSVQAMDGLIQDDVYQISREALTNAFRHAEASFINLDIEYRSDEVIVRVSDDGKGLDASMLSGDYPKGHWGLPGMHERAQRLGASLNIMSEPGQGTSVTLHVPLRTKSPRGDNPSLWSRLARRR